MDTLTYKTVSANAKTVNKNWVIIDAENQILGRVCSKIASMLRGKHKTNFTPHVDCGDNVIVINAEKVRLTGKKWSQKEYISYTGYPGGQRFASPDEMLIKHPTRIVEYAVHGMLPKNKLGNAIKGNLYIYTGPEHPHAAQQPTKVTI